MKIQSESYPDRIRQIAADLNQLRNLYEVDLTIEKLRAIASELERILKAGRKKT